MAENGQGNGKDDGGGKKKSHAGVIPYADAGYWNPDYEPKDTDILAAFSGDAAEGRRPDRGFRSSGRRVVHRHLDRGVDRPPHRSR